VLGYLLGNGPVVGPLGVYAVDADDHSYNFLAVTLGLVRRAFVIDSSTHNFRELRVIEDFEAVIHNATVESRMDYVYSRKCPGSDDPIDFYHRGHSTRTGCRSWTGRTAGCSVAA